MPGPQYVSKSPSDRLRPPYGSASSGSPLTHTESPSRPSNSRSPHTSPGNLPQLQAARPHSLVMGSTEPPDLSCSRSPSLIRVGDSSSGISLQSVISPPVPSAVPENDVRSALATISVSWDRTIAFDTLLDSFTSFNSYTDQQYYVEIDSKMSSIPCLDRLPHTSPSFSAITKGCIPSIFGPNTPSANARMRWLNVWIKIRNLVVYGHYCTRHGLIGMPTMLISGKDRRHSPLDSHSASGRVKNPT